MLPPDLRDFVYRASYQTQASLALAGPVVLSAVAAGVQGVLDVVASYGATLPTSMNFLSTVPTTFRKSSLLRLVTPAFEAFEQGRLFDEEERQIAEQEPDDRELGEQRPRGDVAPAYRHHPMVMGNTTESGLLDVQRAGAMSLYFPHDEGAILLKKLDLSAACQRFDGDPVRRSTRKDGTDMLIGRRTSMALLIQGVHFEQWMNKKGDLPIESGYLPRSLLSFVDTSTFAGSCSGSVAEAQALQQHPFHSRLRDLLKEYSRHLGNARPSRSKIGLDPAAARSWQEFSQGLDWETQPGGLLSDIRPFAGRAGELVVRLAANLQWFSAPRYAVERWAVEAAGRIVYWHLMEAKAAFGEPPIAVQVERDAKNLWNYLNDRFLRTCNPGISRSDLIQCGPVDLRKADRLEAAVNFLQRNGQVIVKAERRKTVIWLPVPSWAHPPQHLAAPGFR